ncbi:MAG: polysaccharide biosynthesis/export family protein [Acidobacteriales bacterium]|nr:polysaccharide biosynthesis/export family protein [Terriglobales bacterium]
MPSFPAGIRILAIAAAVFILGIGQASGQTPLNPPNPPTKDQFPAADGSKSPETAPTGDLNLSTSNAALILGPGDLIEVNVYNVPELTTKSRVGSDGNLYLPLIDYVHVGGLTADQAQALIQERLAAGGFVKSPHVSVFVNEYTSQGVNVLGEVARPGVYPALGERRLFNVISAAGGLTEKAGRSITITRRNPADAPIVVPLTRNLVDSPESNVPIFPGDTVVVRKADIVYVVGDVGRPSGFLMDSGQLTVLQAIALAGGTTRTSKLNGARILHKSAGGMTETEVPLKKILTAKAPDVPLQADDILFVPSSAGRIAAQRSMEAVIQTASALSIVAIHP